MPCLMNKYDLGNLFWEWDGDFGKFWSHSERLAEFQGAVTIVDPHCDDCHVYAQCRGGRKTRIIVENRRENETDLKLQDMAGYDPYCAEDFVVKNPGFVLPTKRQNYYDLKHFRQIFVAHSL